MNTVLAQVMGAAFASPPYWHLHTANARLSAVTGKRRQKLWELPTRWHCPLIGTCLPVATMRKLATRAGFDAATMSDYSLHTVVVGQCDRRTALANSIQRWLDQRYAVALRHFERAKTAAEVLFAWREALSRGEEIAGALWAAWSHGQLDAADGKEIFGDIHMLSHQVGASARADLAELERLRGANARLLEEAAALRLGLELAQREQLAAQGTLQRSLADAEQRAALLPHRERELAELHQAMAAQRPLVERSEALARRAERLKELNASHARRLEILTQELTSAQHSAATAEAALEMVLGVCSTNAGSDACNRHCPAAASLAGRCVLCIGGRTGLIDGYRRLVETQGGRFAHHDGGQEESLHRIDTAVAAADAVVCQAGCISHAAYWRLKEACKKLDKPCVFVQSPGVGSFARGLAVLGGQAPTDRLVTRLAH